jgi:hypothetical protein
MREGGGGGEDENLLFRRKRGETEKTHLIYQPNAEDHLQRIVDN